jgi:hypothetical protein
MSTDRWQLDLLTETRDRQTETTHDMLPWVASTLLSYSPCVAYATREGGGEAARLICSLDLDIPEQF